MIRSEDQLLKRIIPGLPNGDEVMIGPGDDCAVIDVKSKTGEFMLMTVDQVIEKAHYLPERTSPGQVARKLLNRNVSDIAAMGGRPAQALVSIATDRDDPIWFEQFFSALSELAKKWGISVCGGDLSGNPSGTVCTLSLTGWVEADRLCLRSGAKPENIIYGTGEFGDSFATEHHLTFTPRLEEGRFLSRKYAASMMDVSDGLLLDLSRMMTMSGCSAIINPESVPCRGEADFEHALTDGEDYELLFTVLPENENSLLEKWPFRDVRLTRLGVVVEGNAGIVFDEQAHNLLEKHKIGFDHFRKS